MKRNKIRSRDLAYEEIIEQQTNVCLRALTKAGPQFWEEKSFAIGLAVKPLLFTQQNGEAEVSERHGFCPREGLKVCTTFTSYNLIVIEPD